MSRRLNAARWWVYAVVAVIVLTVNIGAAMFGYSPWPGLALIGVQLAVTAWTIHADIAERGNRHRRETDGQ